MHTRKRWSALRVTHLQNPSTSSHQGSAAIFSTSPPPKSTRAPRQTAPRPPLPHRGASRPPPGGKASTAPWPWRTVPPPPALTPVLSPARCAAKRASLVCPIDPTVTAYPDCSQKFFPVLHPPGHRSRLAVPVPPPGSYHQHHHRHIGGLPQQSRMHGLPGRFPRQ